VWVPHSRLCGTTLRAFRLHADLKIALILGLAAGARALALAAEVGGVVLAIDAKDDRAADWYQLFGAVRLLDDPLKLVLPLSTIAAALDRKTR
jgi:hypothetical protein